MPRCHPFKPCKSQMQLHIRDHSHTDQYYFVMHPELCAHIMACWCHMATYVLGNVGSDNDFVPYGTTPLTRPMVTIREQFIYRYLCPQSSKQIENLFYKNHFITPTGQCGILLYKSNQIAKFVGPTWGPSGSCRPQMGPMLAPWTLLSW